MSSSFEVEKAAEKTLQDQDQLQKLVEIIEPSKNGDEREDASWPKEAPRQREPGEDAEEFEATVASEQSEDDAVVWPTLQPAALHGLAAEIVETIEPHSEADRVALLTNLLIEFGNVVGRDPHFRVGGARHGLNLFAVLVGLTAKGRKGTSSAELKPIFRGVELFWAKNCQITGLSTGEGLIWALRDEIREMKPVKEKGQVIRYDEVITDCGVEDKRLFVLETEFGRVLSVMGRDSNTLSAIIRQAWDGDDLRVLTKNSAARVTEPHISIIGHIPQQELLKLLTATDSHNGLANRFLWICARRSRFLPDGGNLQPREIESLTRRLADMVERGKYIGELKRDTRAGEFWHEIYRSLSEGQPGLFGAVTSRAEAQTMRLACLYALLDGKSSVELEHLKAAYALWQYCEDSARFIFGSGTGDAVADKIFAALRKAPQGLTRTEITELLKRNVSSERIQLALGVLVKMKLARQFSEKSSGRPTERWICSD